jgi:hypothetical protein
MPTILAFVEAAASVVTLAVVVVILAQLSRVAGRIDRGT